MAEVIVIRRLLAAMFLFGSLGTGADQRMEYRPYKAVEQFRREIGKYIDTKEVARLERHVTLN